MILDMVRRYRQAKTDSMSTVFAWGEDMSLHAGDLMISSMVTIVDNVIHARGRNFLPRSVQVICHSYFFVLSVIRQDGLARSGDHGIVSRHRLGEPTLAISLLGRRQFASACGFSTDSGCGVRPSHLTYGKKIYYNYFTFVKGKNASKPGWSFGGG